MEYLKQILKSKKLDTNNLKEITEIFEMLGNQQEIKNIFKKINQYLDDIDSSYSIWEISRDKEAVLLTTNIPEGKTQLNIYSGILKKLTKLKKPSTDYADSGIYMVLPILSREEVVGYFCLHSETDLEKKWLDVYIVIQLLSFVLKYYEMIETLKEASVIDVVTGLYNYRHFRLQLQLEIEKSRRFKKPLSLVVVNISDFDSFNNKLGFEKSEVLLREVGKIISSTVRKTDMPARLNDDTFAIILYETEFSGAEKFVDRLKDFISKVPITIDDNNFQIDINAQVLEFTKTMSNEDFFNLVKSL